MRLRSDQASSLSPGNALGESWSFSKLGAYSYDATGPGDGFIFQANVDPDTIHWPATFAMWSSGEGKRRLTGKAEIVLERIESEGGGIVRPDLMGKHFNVRGRIGQQGGR
jgi:hypothetical protein